MNDSVVFWNNLPALIDPIVFSVGFFSVRWYSLMIIVVVVVIYLLGRWRIKHREGNISLVQLEKLLVYLAFGALLGSRLGYILFYNMTEFLQDPLSAISPLENGSFVGISGLSFHGGALGAIAAGLLFCKIHKVNFLDLADFVIPAIPLGYFFGRLGNFLNGELFGRPTDSPLGMFFPTDKTSQLRHPSQLYEAIFEGLFVFAVLWPLRNRKTLRHLFLPLFLILYSVARFVSEFFRMPDKHLGFVFWNFSMGQVLSIATFAFGFTFLFFLKKKK